MSVGDVLKWLGGAAALDNLNEQTATQRQLVELQRFQALTEIIRAFPPPSLTPSQERDMAAGMAAGRLGGDNFFRWLSDQLEVAHDACDLEAVQRLEEYLAWAAAVGLPMRPEQVKRVADSLATAQAYRGELEQAQIAAVHTNDSASANEQPSADHTVIGELAIYIDPYADPAGWLNRGRLMTETLKSRGWNQVQVAMGTQGIVFSKVCNRLEDIRAEASQLKAANADWAIQWRHVSPWHVEADAG